MKANIDVIHTLRKVEVTANKLITIESNVDDIVTAHFVNVDALNVTSMLAAALARAYATFSPERKQETNFLLFMQTMNGQAIKFNHHLENFNGED